MMKKVLTVLCITALVLAVGVTMSFAAKPATYYTLTVASTNPSSGVAITASPLDRNGAGNGTTQFTRSYLKGTVVSLTAPATSTGGNFSKWQKGTADYATTAATTVTMSANTTMTAVYVTPPPTGNHASVTGTYNTPREVTAKCLTCHSSAGPGVNVSSAVPSSLHGMMPTASPNVINNTGLSQKLMEINTFCTYPNPAMAGAACLTCHPTLGKFQNMAASDIDCLMCHSDTYKRKFTPEPDTAKWNYVTDWQGIARTYVPAAKDANGNYNVEFNFSAMPAGTTGLSLIKGVHRPTTTTCLNCHAKAGGSDWAKRGDIGLNSASATSDQDVHLASVANGGAGLSCSSCHVSANHKIPGRGIDLRPTESGVAVKKCTDCHLNFDSGGAHAAAGAPRSEGDRHVKRVACQACHITAFGKGGATEIARNWKGTIEWNQALCMGQGGWAPQETDVSNGIPDFVFFNKTSYVYKLGETLNRIDPVSGLTTMADAVGGANDALGVSFLTPIKRHTSNMAVMNSGTNAGKVIPFDVVWQFMTGYADQAAERGKAFAGWTGTHEWKTLEAELALNHGVSPAARVTCTNCHHSRNQFSTAYVTKLDKLGYKLKDANKDGLVNAADEAIICSQCHLQKAFKSDWQMQHNHVSKGSGIGCSFCHDIKRPERGLCEPCNANGTENTACITEFVDTNYYNHCQ
jgi:nitrate reductase cytochrome c-type subunit